MACLMTGAQFREIIAPALRMTDAERASVRRAAWEQEAGLREQERAKYDAMTDAQRRQYDAMTRGMMPRLPA